VLGDSENFLHNIYGEKVSRYWIYCDTCFASCITGRRKAKGAVAPQPPLLPGAAAKGAQKNLTKIF